MVNESEAFSLLELEPGATQASIKRAFRRLAMRWHPDRNPDPAALEHFKRLRAAHDSLLESFEADTPLPSTQDAGHATSAPRAADRRRDLEIDLEQAVLGGEASLVFDIPSPCSDCDGSGWQTWAHSRLCPDCHGSGRIRTANGLTPCAVCNGRGYSNRTPCTCCDGSGQIVGHRTLTVRIPPGIAEGDLLRLEGEGEPASDAGGLPGDLLLRIRLRPHPLYRVIGRDVVIERPVSIFTLLGGGQIRVPGPSEPHTLNIEAGSAAPRTVRIEGAGLPARSGFAAGALCVSLNPVTPAPTSDKSVIELYRAIQGRLTQDQHMLLPELDTWEHQWLPPL
ncbi:DnaJ domain-containing protein [Azoarcus communis]|uniref:DnaJ C-terminal domain-containing protein n=1 Tax=Parazoarcus communis TaxID=41977 RepID=UPI0014598F1A|nr:J domain-containing protein [Parazoarcus communis]NMG46978.1 DnaJ domain-containing protein [Parazoarcus communis]